MKVSHEFTLPATADTHRRVLMLARARGGDIREAMAEVVCDALDALCKPPPEFVEELRLAEGTQPGEVSPDDGTWIYADRGPTR